MRYTYMILVKPKSGHEAEWERWHGERHAHDMMRVPGVVGCRRYRANGWQPGTREWDFMVLYDLDTDDPGAVLAEVGRRFGTELMPATDAGDPSKTVRGVWSLVTEYPP